MRAATMITLVALIAAALSIRSAGAAQLLFSSEETPDLSGYTTYTLSLLTEGSEVLRGVDAVFNGPMNQVNPFDLPTIFMDNNVVITAVGDHVKQDSQFLFPFTSVLSIGAEESSTLLKAAMSGLADNGLPNPAPIAQIVTNDAGRIVYQLAFDLGASGTFRTGVLIDPGLRGYAEVYIDAAPTTGLPGMTTYTLYLDLFNGFLQGADATIEGALNQVSAIGGGDTTFASDLECPLNALCPFDSTWDTQFLFDRPSLVGNEQDDAATLAATFSVVPSIGPGRIPFAQITTDDPTTVSYQFQLDLGDTQPFVLSGRLIPEPSSALLAALATMSLACRRVRI